MKKYKNVGKLVGFMINERMFDFQNGEVVEVPDNFKEDINSALSKLEELKEKAAVVQPVVQSVALPPEETKPTYTEKELYNLTKSQQVKFLNDLGITKIPSLEKDRVKLILELAK